MPPPRLTGSTKLLAGAIASVVGAVVIVGLALVLASNDSTKNQLGDRFFTFNPEHMAKQVAVAPVPFNDAIGAGRDVFVQHLDPDVRKGWLVFETRAPGAAPECQAVWDPAARVFRDCTGTAFPADGTGLTHYTVVVPPKGDVQVDLKTPAGLSTPPASAPTTTTTTSILR